MSFTNLSQLLCNMYVVWCEHSIGFVLVNVHHCFINVDTLARIFLRGNVAMIMVGRDAKALLIFDKPDGKRSLFSSFSTLYMCYLLFSDQVAEMTCLLFFTKKHAHSSLDRQNKFETVSLRIF